MGKKQVEAGWFDYVVYHIITVFFLLLGRIPPKTAARIADMVGRLWFALDRRHRRVAIENLTMVYGNEMSPDEIRHFALQVFKSLSLIVFEIGWSLHLDKARMRRHFRFYGLHHLHLARKKGSGTLILTAHIGNWELLVAAAGMIGLPVNAVYRPFDFKPLDMFFETIRGRSGASLFPKKMAVRKILRSLRRNEGVGILLDQSTSISKSVLVDFFGRPASTSKGLALLARTTGAPVIPAFFVRENGFFSIKFGPEIPFLKTGNTKADIRENTQLYNRVIESIIMEHPEQWFWIHRRWKSRT
jgi:Kdo2-lipid IVA lauroyltransferase/acyltransferase